MRTVAILPRVPAAAPMASVRWFTLLAAAVVLLILFVTGGNSAALIGLTLGTLIVGTAAIDRRLLIPLVIALLPMEIWADLSPVQFSGESLVDRLGRSTILTTSRLAIMGLGAYWLLTARPGWERKLPQSRMIAPAAALLALFVLGTLWSIDFEQGFIFSLALSIHFAFLLLIPVLVRDRTTLAICIWTLIGVLTALAFAGIYQQATDTFFWRPFLGAGDTPRINATFKDPNIYARILIVAMTLAIAAVFSIPRRLRLGTLLAVLPPCLLALMFTNSRAGWLIVAGALPLTIVLLPLPLRTRIVVAAAAVAGGALLLLIGGALFDATFFERLRTLSDPGAALGAREGLMKAGWHMFADQPLSGVGEGGFQKALEGPYYRFTGEQQFLRASLSHTEMITVSAELGLAGLIVVMFLFSRFVTLILDLHRVTIGADRAMVVGLGMGVLVIFLSSQAESRMLGEPYLWLLFGLTMAFEGIIRRERGLDAAD